uniref:Uncharacterized protein n=1 Tax=Chromera velia CCMP2878 TaxID=1169474 RepID=A0A0G4I5X1_9ALVE|mmetsp:Transcript_44236/g.87272  ORF Transcript_44236/g.87272 Transcript_44236/m.87272 type:complete len:431 (-) Transcript_44236:243-1535(-)|eukprot:Cvel_11253.t1-p1 / transcript=Cvel_11253.t1 / gene=Cvel_11253 / organism=Chromera_velia_CCMP2878 / gene_product=hypothetical protein / transcript_product=hypothetical protein / location=Cvel_scaffold701:47197-52958(-) / protein_length=430 / sequence_SO=supercontig / SO=protein_coding / is_pseudo=false
MLRAGLRYLPRGGRRANASTQCVRPLVRSFSSQGKNADGSTHVPPTDAPVTKEEGAKASTEAAVSPEATTPSPPPVSENAPKTEASDPPKKFTWTRAFLMGSGIGLSGIVGFFVYKADFNLAKAEWLMGEWWIDNVSGRPGLPENVRNSQYKSCLKEETMREFAIFFLQLDSDKSNGVVRSDLLSFLEQDCGLDIYERDAEGKKKKKKSDGVEKEEEKGSVKRFVKKGLGGRTDDKKRVSGCSLQEGIEFLEDFVLEHRGRELEEKNQPEGEKLQSDSEEGTGKEKKEGDIEETLLLKLKELNKGANLDAILPPSFPVPPTDRGPRPEIRGLSSSSSSAPEAPPPPSSSLPGAPLSEVEAEEVDVLRLEEERLTAVVDNLEALKKAGKLSEAEDERLVDTQKALLEVRDELRRLNFKSSSSSSIFFWRKQ